MGGNDIKFIPLVLGGVLSGFGSPLKAKLVSLLSALGGTLSVLDFFGHVVCRWCEVVVWDVIREIRRKVSGLDVQGRSCRYCLV